MQPSKSTQSCISSRVVGVRKQRTEHEQPYDDVDDDNDCAADLESRAARILFNGGRGARNALVNVSVLDVRLEERVDVEDA